MNRRHRLIGRERELDDLRAALTNALATRTQLVLLAGEPGIGKTRLCEEIACAAAGAGAQPLWGACHEGAGAPAFWPWVQIIRAHADDANPQSLTADLGAGAPEIALIVPQLRAHLPDLPVPAPLAGEQARFRLFDAVTTFFKSASKRRPLVLCLEDIHWADRSSLLLLHFLARELRAVRVLMIATYRDDEVGRAHPLSRTLGDLVREQITHRVVLAGLSPTEVGNLIAVSLGHAPSDELTRAVHDETEGNPFFVSEIVQLLLQENGIARQPVMGKLIHRVPESVREVIGRRLDHLSADCNAVLSAASVIGRQFSLDVLRVVTSVDGERLLLELEEATRSRVITALSSPPPRYAFVHALIREALYSELSAVERLKLHKAVGEALEDRARWSDEADPAELAHHFLHAALGGGDVEKAAAYATRAGDRAMALFAYDEAAAHFRKALDALGATRAHDDASRCELLLRLGVAERCAGDIVRAGELLHRAAAVARTIAAWDRFAQAAVELGAVGPTLATVDAALLALLDEALAHVPDESELRSRLLARLATALHYVPHAGARARAVSREALDVAVRSGRPAALADALHARHFALWGPDNVEERLRVTDEMSALAERLGNAELALHAHYWRALDALELGELASADREMDAFEVRASFASRSTCGGSTSSGRCARCSTAGSTRVR